jgi:hypothetical protein
MANLTVEQLLAKVAEGKKPRRRIEENTNVLRFIKETKLEPGTKAYPNYVIFWYYRTQWPGDRHNKATKIGFFRTFSKKFTIYRNGRQRYYLLKEDFLELTDKVLEKARIYELQHAQADKKREPRVKKDL